MDFAVLGTYVGGCSVVIRKGGGQGEPLPLTAL